MAGLLPRGGVSQHTSSGLLPRGGLEQVAAAGGGDTAAISSAAGVATTSTLTGGATAVAAITGASGASTVSTLTGSGSSIPYFDLTGAAYEFRNNTGTLIASTAITFWVNNVTTGALVAEITGLSTDASGIVGTVADAAMSDATEYRVNYEFATGEYGVAKLTTA